ncbi:MAG: Unknown protein [uncultured Sulfurovum sp.]|uniref:Alpha-ketoglutarate-dependent dioxygenase AlkB-like domain-containing protein n=1 Tax=uncultured Sulfurovum sp. TaxID=269237 RepID=A0A6S6TW54_9BACT|nr:MAG: Unknown protein [uncultured Sulfurovum sp.]
MNKQAFYKTTLALENNLFEKLLREIEFEKTGKGRVGNHLVKRSNSTIPIVRTTTQYTIPAHYFSFTHEQIIASIIASLTHLPSINFNNALIEVYDKTYTKMKYHSDQCQDLALNSYIGLFSCYENPNTLREKSIRKLIIKDKRTYEEFEIPLTHNSFILFSLESNSKFLHKIVLDSQVKHKHTTKENKWLGITLRESKTFVHFQNDVPYLANGEVLTLATESEEREYFKLKGKENRAMEFIYPSLNYTISKADRIMPL